MRSSAVISPLTVSVSCGSQTSCLLLSKTVKQAHTVETFGRYAAVATSLKEEPWRLE